MNKEEYWTKIHQDDYSDVWSLTEDLDAFNMITDQLIESGCERILIPGCGSRGLLENDIAFFVDDATEVVATDFEGVIDCIDAPKDRTVRYEARDSTNLEYEDYFDAVVVVNSILSDDHQENVNILKSCHKALRKGGILIGFFPTIFCSVDLMYTAGKVSFADLIDIKENKFYDPNQHVSQIFYSPLNLRKILRETDYNLWTMEIAFFDSEHAVAESKKHYGLEGVDDVVYEHFVVASKD